MQRIDHPSGTAHAVFVKPPAPPGTAIPGSPATVDIVPAPLGHDRIGSKDRVLVAATNQDPVGIDQFGLVQDTM
jgi:hypothetical protein